jgi:hypothetical protein
VDVVGGHGRVVGVPVVTGRARVGFAFLGAVGWRARILVRGGTDRRVLLRDCDDTRRRQRNGNGEQGGEKQPCDSCGTRTGAQAGSP